MRLLPRDPSSLLAVTAAFFLTVALSGCFSPSLNIVTKQSTQVTVGQLVDHLACQLAEAYDLHSDEPRWQHLIEDNYVAQIDLTLMVTESGGFNPTFSWLRPTLGNGNGTPAIYGTGPNPAPTNGNFNQTLAIGVQLNGSQDRNVEEDYSIDLHALWNAYRNAGPTKQNMQQKVEDSHSKDLSFPFCMPRRDKEHYPALHSPLQGNMALSETVENGLESLDRSAQYNIYGASGPIRYVDSSPGPAGSPLMAKSALLAVPENAIAAFAAGGPAPSAAGGSASGVAKTTFGAKIDFYLTEGVNSGIAFSYLKHKLSAGGGGGGGGSGGAGGSGGSTAGGGAGGGGGQLLSLTRTTQDSMTVTFGATCAAPVDEVSHIGTLHVPADSKKTPMMITWAASDVPGETVTATLKLKDGLFTQGAFSTQGSQIFDTVTVRQDASTVAIGAIQWTGYVLDTGRFAFRGNISSAVTGQSVGQVWIKGDNTLYVADTMIQLPDLIEHMPMKLAENLNDEVATQDYWSAVPPCDVATASQKQSAIDAIATQNLYQTFFRQ